MTEMRPRFDFSRARSEFPTLVERAYFASQSLGPYPRAMLDDLRAYERSLALRTRAFEEWLERWHEMHRLTEDLLEAPRGSVFLRDSSTAAQAAIAACIAPEGERRRILVGSTDFHSSRFLWGAQKKRGFEIVEVHTDDDAESLCRAIDERTSLVALSLVSPQTGVLLDAPAVAAASRRAGAICVIDAYQAVGVVPVRVAEIGADVIVGGYHKWLGGACMGLAFGYVRPSLSAMLDPVHPGWLGHKTLFSMGEPFEPAPTAERFQQGSPAMEPIYTARAGLKWVMNAGIDAIRARSLELTEYLLAGLRERGIAVRTPSEGSRRGGSLCIPVADPEVGNAAVARLGERGIDIDARPAAGIRVGPHPCGTEAECDMLVAALGEMIRF